jgi:hypothetical protein
MGLSELARPSRSNCSAVRAELLAIGNETGARRVYVVTVFKILPDNDYALLTPAPRHADAFHDRMTGGMDFDRSGRGVSL